MSMKETEVTGLPSDPVAETSGGTRYVVREIIFSALGLLAAPFVMSVDSNFEARVEAERANDTLWVFVALTAIRFVLECSTILSNDARFHSRVRVPTQIVYRSTKAGDDHALVVANAGAVGRLNRAQRARANTIETLVIVIAQLLALYRIAPRSSCALVVGICVARTIFVVGYTSALQKRLPGFILSKVIFENLLNGVVLKLALEAFR